MNEYIILQNDHKTISEVRNVIAGVQMNKRKDYVVFEWYVWGGDGMERLIYEPQHNLETDNRGREVNIVINPNWYINRNDYRF